MSAGSSKVAIYGAIGANIAIAISKFVAAFFTGSSAMLARQQPGVEQVRRPLTMYLGPQDAVLALDVEFHDYLSAGKEETAFDQLQDSIRAKFPEFKRTFIEAKGLSAKMRTTVSSDQPVSPLI